MKSNFQKKIEVLLSKHEALITRKNIPQEDSSFLQTYLEKILRGHLRAYRYYPRNTRSKILC